MPFPYVVVARLGAKPLEPFGKGSNALKAGTRDAGPVRSYRAPYRGHGRPFSPRPGSSGKQGLYAPWAETQADQLSGVGSDVWMSSARRTARVTPSRICPGLAATELGIWRPSAACRGERRGPCCKSFCLRAGSVQARDRSASVSGGKELMSTDFGASQFNHAGIS